MRKKIKVKEKEKWVRVCVLKKRGLESEMRAQAQARSNWLDPRQTKGGSMEV